MPVSILQNIQSHQDLAQLDPQQRQSLCREIREFLIENVSKTGGHVASNLGVVELTVAIETVYNTQKDRLVFDVGHQSYIHKMLTGRQADFSSLRQFGGIAGFPKPTESAADSFVAGHASSSVSIALGMARARTLTGGKYDVIAVMGDGAATGGMAYEGLSDAAVSGEPMVVVLNDNAMSIDRNVGGMASHLRQLRIKERYLSTKERYRNSLLKVPGGRWFYRLTRNIKDRLRRMLIPSTVFENMGFTYWGPVDGHDVENLIHLLQTARHIGRPVLLHVVTQKGRGYAPAQEHPKLFHGIGKFDPVTGVPAKSTVSSFSDAFGEAMVALGAETDRLCAITAAMPGGTGLLSFQKQFPKRTFDVGIAEEHAVSMAGGLAKQGMVPVVALYSTFLQRAYDQILQDVCMQGLHVVFAIDRAGLVGEDGETHHGIYDVGFLRHAPGLRILCPGSRMELQTMLRWAVMEQNGPVAIRYPRGSDRGYVGSAWDGQTLLHQHRVGQDVTILTYGALLQNGMQAAELLENRGIKASVIRLMEINPLPVGQLLDRLDANVPLILLEETGGNCGIRESLAYEIHRMRPDIKVLGLDLGCRYIQHGAVDRLYSHYGIDGESVADFVQEVLKDES